MAQNAEILHDYSKAAAAAYEMVIKVEKGMSRRDTLALIYRRTALEVKCVEQDAAEERKNSLALAATGGNLQKLSEQ